MQSLQVKGLQNYSLSKFENGLTLDEVERACTHFCRKGQSSRLFLDNSKFDSQQLHNPLIYRPHINSIEGSKPFKEVYKKSRGQQHFEGHSCCLKVTSLTQGLLNKVTTFIWHNCMPPKNAPKGLVVCQSNEILN